MNMSKWLFVGLTVAAAAAAAASLFFFLLTIKRIKSHFSLELPPSTSPCRRRGRRGDISLRLGGRIQFPDVEQVEAVDPSGEAAPIALYTSRTESRLNQYADDFLAELESTFSRREKAIPKTRLYSDYYEREVTTEAPTESQAAPAGGRGRRNRERGRDRDRDRNRRSDSRDWRHESGRADEWTVFAGPSTGSPSGGRGRRGGDSRNERGKEHEEALRALDARLGLPADDRVDEFGRARRD